MVPGCSGNGFDGQWMVLEWFLMVWDVFPGSLCPVGPKGLTRERVAGGPANFFTAENKPFCKKGGMSGWARRIHFYIKIRHFFEICLKMDIEIYRKNAKMACRAVFWTN